MPQTSHHPRCVGSVSFLNAKPLLYGLENDPDIQMILDVPAKLLNGLEENRFDLALLPVIDFQKLPGLRVVPSGGIGCDGPTLTVRIFSPVPIDRITALACDADSHTSVALARILLAERYKLSPEMIELDESRALPAGAALLLIGDKVVSREPRGFPYQLDLGAAWKDLTRLPFVFAVWVARGGINLGDLPQRLERAKQNGLADLGKIVARHAGPHGWPAELAMKYFTDYIRFDIGPSQLAAIRRFHELAFKHRVIPEIRPLELY